jgi:hypothetical protein
MFLRVLDRLLFNFANQGKEKRWCNVAKWNILKFKIRKGQKEREKETERERRREKDN